MVREMQMSSIRLLRSLLHTYVEAMHCHLSFAVCFGRCDLCIVFSVSELEHMSPGHTQIPAFTTQRLSSLDLFLLILFYCTTRVISGHQCLHFLRSLYPSPPLVNLFHRLCPNPSPNGLSFKPSFPLI